MNYESIEAAKAEFKRHTKPKMVVAIIELMLFDGWDIQSFVYTFRTYTKEKLIDSLDYYLDYHYSLQPKD